MLFASRGQFERKKRSEALEILPYTFFSGWLSGLISMALVKDAKSTAAETDPRWQRVLTRDASADGTFVYAVRTTGVYCRPSCPSRAAKPENVEFFAHPADADAAGYRACLRCRPNGLSPQAANLAVIEDACRWIECAPYVPTLHALAQRAGMSPFHFHRLFKSLTGVTPKAYATALRAKTVRAQLGDTTSTITHALYAAGFNSNSRFYEGSDAILGMTPTTFRNGGAETDIRFAVGQCSLGAVLVAQSERGVCAISLGDDPAVLIEALCDRFPKATLVGDDRDFERLVAMVVGFIDKPQIGLGLPLDIRGTAFQQRVWRALMQIPIGTTASYSEIAERIGEPKAVRAVASACAANTIAVAIPCHRVVRTGGGLSGYRWGGERKRALLKTERED